MFFQADHPFNCLAPIWADPANQLEVSRYEYRPDTVLDVRQVIQLSTGPSAGAQMQALMEQLRPGEELALHSSVRRAGEIWHIPMLDCSCQTLSADNVQRFQKMFPQEVSEQGAWFDSGRSYHFYSKALLHEAEWISFLGRALLVNEPDQAPLVDSRWIGHRLLAGYGALRQSCNSPHYLKMPSLTA